MEWRIILRIALYCRVSTDSQELSNQLLQLRDYASSQKWEIVKEYKEIISGTKDKRQAFDAMLVDAAKRRFDLLLFWDLCRFSRSGTLFTLQKLRQLENYGCGWHSFQEPYISTTGPWKDVVLSIFATMAKLERDRISERTKAGLARAAKQGRFPGRPRKVKSNGL
jgi:DNA invertase Pin-like site-specific DNA recombinase